MTEFWKCLNATVRGNFPKMQSVLFVAAILVVFFFLGFKINDKKNEIKNAKTWIKMIILSLSLSLVLVMTLIGRESGERTVFRWKLLESYFEIQDEYKMKVFIQMILNMTMFIPLGFALPYCFSFFRNYKRVLVIAIGCSSCIELVQGFTKIGLFELDDILCNTIGASVGIAIYKILLRMKNKG